MLGLRIRTIKSFIPVVIHEKKKHTSYRFNKIFELNLTGSKIDQPHTPNQTSLQYFNDRISPVSIEIIHGSHRLLEIYTWPGP